MAREAIAVAGAAVGFVATGFNPAGAYYGFTIGYAVGGYLDPVKVPAPGVSEAPIQTSRDGTPITIFWALQAGAGNILQKNPETIVTTTSSSGKGGGTDVEEKRRYRTYAIGVGSGPFGPIAGLWRIWRNNKLVYDMRPNPAIPIEETNKFAAGIRIYNGTEDQLPDPDLEAHWGIADTPAYRDRAYVVFINDDLTDVGGAIPQYRFEVNGSRDATITSEPYPADALEGLIPELTLPTTWLVQWPVEAVEQTSAPLGGTLGEILEEYAYEEAVEQTSAPLGGTLGEILEEYAYEEAVEQTSAPLGGTLGEVLVSYQWTEAVEQTSAPEGGTLT